MARKASIINSSLIGIFLFISHVAISKAEPTETQIRQNRDSEIESSITSGIRNLEYIRRQIIDSRNQREDYNRALHWMKEPQTSVRSKYSGIVTNEEKSLPARLSGSRHPRRQVDSTMYEALSKIANIQVADPNIEHSSESSSGDESNGRRALRPNFYHSVNEEMNNQFYKNFEPTRTLRKEGSSPETSIATSNKLSLNTRKFHCRPIRDIYIPKVDKRMPAYLCALGRRAFVISSERFLQDKRDHFEVSVDENTFRRMNPLDSGSATLTSGVSVLPATLVLKQGENGYTVRGMNKVQGT